MLESQYMFSSSPMVHQSFQKSHTVWIQSEGSTVELLRSLHTISLRNQTQQTLKKRYVVVCVK